MDNSKEDVSQSSAVDEKKSSGAKFYAELKRRRVLSFTAGYILSAWFVIEVASVVLPAFEAPEWFLRLLIIAVVLASPVVVVLAWFYDFTRKGIVFTDDVDKVSTDPGLPMALLDNVEGSPDEPSPAMAEVDTDVARHSGPERRLVTVLQCSTTPLLAEQNEDHTEAFRALLPDLIKRYRDIVEDYEGYLLPTEGELVTAYYGVHIAHEDASARAIRSARDMVRHVEDFNAAVTAEDGLKLEVNVGVHCGFAIVEEVPGESVDHWVSNIGHTLKSVAALQISAQPNEIRLSHDVRGILQEDISCERVGSMSLPGSAVPKDIYRVIEDVGQLRAFPRPSRAMIGRERETELLDECWTNAQESRGQVVLLRGESGIGKTRLIGAVLDKKAREEKTRFIVLHCSAYRTHSSLFPVIDYLQKELGFSSADDNGEKLARLESYLRRNQLPVAEILPGFAALLSLELSGQQLHIEPERQKELMLRALYNILLQPTDDRAVFMLVEDLHWADPTFLDLLDLVIGQIPTERALLLLTCRPTFKARWTDHSHINLLNVNRLNNRQARELIRAIDEEGCIEEDLVQNIIDKTDGVPLYLEEFSKSVIDAARHGQRLDDSRVLKIPNTLQESLTARIHHLGSAKSLLHLGSAIGREFSHALLSANSDLPEDELNENLSELIDREVIHKRGMGDEASYVFKHALIQEAAYSSMLKSKREEYHLMVARSLEQDFTSTVEQQPEIIAHHYSASDAVGQNLDKASEYWRKAAQVAARRFANVEADHFLNNALQQLERKPADSERDIAELGIHSSRIPVLVALHGYSSAPMAVASDRALALCETVADFENKFMALFGVCVFYMVGGQHRASNEVAQQIEEICRDQVDEYRLEAFMLLGLTHFFLGNIEDAKTNLLACVKLYDRDKHGEHGLLFGQDPEIISMSYLAWVYFSLGDSDNMLRNRERLLERARSLQHPNSLAFAHCMTAWQMFLLEDLAGLQDQLVEVVTVSEKFGLSSFKIQSQILSALVQCRNKDYERGLESLELGLEAWRGIGSRCYLVCWDAFFARECIAAGLHDKASEILERAELELAQTEEHWAECELLSCRALLTQACGDSELAKTHGQQAVARSIELQCPGWGLRASFDYANYLLSHDKPEAMIILNEALSVLPPATLGELEQRPRRLLETLED